MILLCFLKGFIIIKNKLYNFINALLKDRYLHNLLELFIQFIVICVIFLKKIQFITDYENKLHRK